jgi:heat shock protein HslJ
MEGMETETAFLKALQSVDRWKITGQRLELFDATGTLLARFDATHVK